MSKSASTERRLKKNLSVKAATAAGLTIKDFFGDKVPAIFDWELAVKMCNAIIDSGDPITKDSGIGEVIKVLGKAMERSGFS
jgi:hypothetical protein